MSKTNEKMKSACGFIDRDGKVDMLIPVDSLMLGYREMSNKLIDEVKLNTKLRIKFIIHVIVINTDGTPEKAWLSLTRRTSDMLLDLWRKGSFAKVWTIEYIAVKGEFEMNKDGVNELVLEPLVIPGSAHNNTTVVSSMTIWPNVLNRSNYDVILQMYSDMLTDNKLFKVLVYEPTQANTETDEVSGEVYSDKVCTNTLADTNAEVDCTQFKCVACGTQLLSTGECPNVGCCIHNE